MRPWGLTVLGGASDLSLSKYSRERRPTTRVNPRTSDHCQESLRLRRIPLAHSLSYFRAATGGSPSFTYDLGRASPLRAALRRSLALKGGTVTHPVLDSLTKTPPGFPTESAREHRTNMISYVTNHEVNLIIHRITDRLKPNFLCASGLRP